MIATPQPGPPDIKALPIVAPGSQSTEWKALLALGVWLVAGPFLTEHGITQEQVVVISDLALAAAYAAYALARTLVKVFALRAVAQQQAATIAAGLLAARATVVTTGSAAGSPTTSQSQSPSPSPVPS